MPHPLNLIEVDNEALVVTVVLLDALATENCEVIGTVKVLHSLRVDVAQFVLQRLLILLVEVEVRLRQDLVLLYHLVQNVNIEGKAFSTLELFD